MRRFSVLVVMIVIVGCGQAQEPPTTVPTFGAILSTPRATNPQAMQAQSPTIRPATAIAPATEISPTASIAGPNDQQYRRWMQEARDLHPYQESVDTMWAVMLCESGGNPAAQGTGELIGLFQYQPSTWSDAWNPYRDQPITDARAQIFATAKAWSDGYQGWWQVCLP